MKKNTKNHITIALIHILLFSSCKKFVEVPPPKSSLVSETVFNSDNTAIAAMSSVYGLMNTSGFASGTIQSISYLCGLSSDELQNFNTNVERIQFSTNSLTQSNSVVESLWASIYTTIYRVNAIIEGVSRSNSLSTNTKRELIGQSKFIRGFCYFYIVNLFGRAPLTLETDFRVTMMLPRATEDQVYEQIIKDLTEAQQNLSTDYSASGGERVRPNRWAATALLARVFLYRKDWKNAETESTKIIENSSLFKLTPIKDVFLKNSTEVIWQLNNNTFNTNESATFIFTSRPSNAAIPESFYNKFEQIDQRRINWITAKLSGSTTYYQINKYKSPRIPTTTIPITQPTEYSTVFRVAEQVLIRAEARLHLGKLNGPNTATSDLNMIRNRAGLTDFTESDPKLISAAIEKERLFELFSEWGHRWLDLKRLPHSQLPDSKDINRADEVLQPIKPSWKKEWKLYPLPKNQINRNPSMNNDQNPGYN